MLVIALASSGIGLVLVILGVAAVLSALYSLIFRRRGWLGIPHHKAASIIAICGVASFIFGGAAAGSTHRPAQDASTFQVSDTSGLSSTPEPTPTAETASATPTPTETSPIGTLCTQADAMQTYNNELVVCTETGPNVLIWMSDEDNKTLVAAKALAVKKAADKVAADKAAADKAAAAKVAAAKAAENKRAADAAAAATKAAPAPAPAHFVAPPVEQAPVEQAPAQQAPAAAYYPNCAAVRAAGAAPIYAGSPGYSTKLDRDGDGVACE